MVSLLYHNAPHIMCGTPALFYNDLLLLQFIPPEYFLLQIDAPNKASKGQVRLKTL